MNQQLEFLIRSSRGLGFTINLDNYEIEIYRPNATVSAVFNRNDLFGQMDAAEYIRSYFAEQARNEQNAIRRGRVAGLW